MDEEINAVIDKVVGEVGPIAQDVVREAALSGMMEAAVGVFLFIVASVAVPIGLRRVSKIEDPDHRQTGKVVCWLIAAGLVGIGTGCLAEGLNWAVSPTFHILRDLR